MFLVAVMVKNSPYQNAHNTRQSKYVHIVVVAQPAQQFSQAMQISKFLSLFISLEIDCFDSQ